MPVSPKTRASDLERHVTQAKEGQNQMVAAAERLAIDGGTPVRREPLRAEYPGASLIGEEERREVLDALDRQTLFRYYGPQQPDKVATLEREFATHVGSRWALAVTSGTAALRVGITALGIGPADEVIVPAITFIASAGAVLAARAYCVFAECDESFGLDPQDVERKITPRTRAIMPVHLGGVACRMDEIMAVAQRHNVPVIEDCAQSAGASYRARRVGSIGAAGCFSLQTQKIITAGEGGIVTTSDPVVYERAFRAHDHGGYRYGGQGVRVSGSTAAAGADEHAPPPPRLPPFVGEVYRMGELNGAVALAQLRKLDGILAACRAIKRRLTAELRDTPGLRLRDVPDPEGDAGVRLGFLLDDASRAQRFAAAMRAEGVPVTNVYGGKPVYAEEQILRRRASWGDDPQRPLVPAGDSYGPPVRYEIGMCPRTEAMLPRAFSLGLGPHYTNRDVDDIVTALRKVARAVL
jgi:8-amino-3,8-dideoxy-alpha-D-manno-octulosonate transaminase